MQTGSGLLLNHLATRTGPLVSQMTLGGSRIAFNFRQAETARVCGMTHQAKPTCGQDTLLSMNSPLMMTHQPDRPHQQRRER